MKTKNEDLSRGEVCYKSNLLDKYFDSYDELVKAEEAYEAEKAEKNKLATERKARAEEVKKARADARDANKKYKELLTAFIEDYGSWHDTIEETTADGWIKSIFDIFRF